MRTPAWLHDNHFPTKMHSRSTITVAKSTIITSTKMHSRSTITVAKSTIITSTVILSERISMTLFYRLVSMTIYSAYDSILSVLNSLRISVFLYRKRSYWLLDIIWFMKYWLTINCKINIYILITVFSDQISIAFFCGFDMSSRKF